VKQEFAATCNGDAAGGDAAWRAARRLLPAVGIIEAALAGNTCLSVNSMFIGAHVAAHVSAALNRDESSEVGA